MVIYIETERLNLRDWETKDLLPFQKMNANTQVRRYFPSLLSYRRSEIDMENMDSIIQESGLGLFAVELKETGEWLGFIGVNYVSKDSHYPFKELTCLLSVGSLKELEGCNEVTPQPSLLQAEQAQLPQPVFIGEALQPSDHLCGPTLDPL